MSSTQTIGMQSPSGSGFSSSDEGAPPSPPSPPSASAAPSGKPKRARGRVANVYDAVAGRITLNGALIDSDNASSRSKRRLSTSADRYSSRNPKLAPEEALFRRKNAPLRYAEHDIYWANEDLPDSGRLHLPDGALLKSVHGYASRFYEAAAARLGSHCVVGAKVIDERSMDETALLAFGILLDEASRDALGKRGDLVFTEAASTDSKTAAKVAQGAKVPGFTSEDTQAVEEVPASQNTGRRKRRKVARAELPGKQES